VTVALVTVSPLAIVQQFGTTPNPLAVPDGTQVHAASIGWTSADGKYMLADVVNAGTPPDQFATISGTSLSLVGNTLTITTSYQANAPSKAQLTAYAASKRAAKMLGGTTVSGVPIPTDAGTLCLLTMAYVKSVQTGTFTMNWYNTATQTWITLNAAAIQNAAQTVGVFLASCLASEQQADAGINAGTITTIAQVDALF
jgi:hypothetical protein